MADRCCISGGGWQQDENEKSGFNMVIERKRTWRSTRKTMRTTLKRSPHNLWASMGKAFITGGLICTLGQLIMNRVTNTWGLEAEAAGAWTSIILVFLSALCTGLNIYQKLVKFGGAGALVPITGFANSVAAPAVEFRSEGQVFGIGVKIFTIAGPVILYGVGASWILGVGYWVLQKM